VRRLGERGVSDVVQGLDLPVITDQGCQLGGVGLLSGEAGDGVNGLDGGPSGLAVGATALDLHGLPGSGGEQALDRDHLDPSDLRASVADAPHAALQRDLCPRKGSELLAELLLVALDDHDVVGFTAEKVVGVLALGVHGVAGDDHPGQVGHGLQQRLEAGDLVRLLADVQLSQDQAGTLCTRIAYPPLPCWTAADNRIHNGSWGNFRMLHAHEGHARAGSR
jgi:hypothetical protein